MNTKKKRRIERKIISTEQHALRELRLEQGLTLKEAGKLLGVSQKTLGALENGRITLEGERIEEIVNSYGLDMKDFERRKRIIRKEGPNSLNKKTLVKKVLSNKDRRSYQKIVTKECKVLRSMRRQIGVSQDRASALCGYSRPTIGHIENGRIELTRERVEHILKCYGSSMKEFEENFKKESQRDEIIDSCVEKISHLSEEKLKLLSGILENF